MARSLGAALRARRIELGLTQEVLATRIGDGVRQADISRLERDGIALPRRGRLERIAAALDLPVGELLELAGWTGAHPAMSGPTLVPGPADQGLDRAAPAPAVPRAVPAPAVPRAKPELERLWAAIARSQEIRAKQAALLARLDATWSPQFGIPSTRTRPATDRPVSLPRAPGDPGE